MEGMDGLIIRAPWAYHILSGQKIWEIRGTRTKKRGRIALIQAGTKTIVGFCDLVDVVGPLTLARAKETVAFHLLGPEDLKCGLPYEKTYAWVLRNPAKLDKPIPYEHPSGAVIWVKLPPVGEEGGRSAGSRPL